jgi:hypothetical protein
MSISSPPVHQTWTSPVNLIKSCNLTAQTDLPPTDLTIVQTGVRRVAGPPNPVHFELTLLTSIPYSIIWVSILLLVHQISTYQVYLIQFPMCILQAVHSCMLATAFSNIGLVNQSISDDVHPLVVNGIRCKIMIPPCINHLNRFINNKHKISSWSYWSNS